jgi:AbrB family looped-hinge helix DNA binding protein
MSVRTLELIVNVLDFDLPRATLCAKYKSVLYFCITLGETLIEEEMKVGPKGQVVIPCTMRKALRISPGSKVIFKLDDGRLILEKPELDAVAIFRRTAKQINHNTRVNTHQYEEELEERNP